MFGSRIFVRPEAGTEQHSFNLVHESAVFAEYRERRQFVGGDIGLSVSRQSEISGGLYASRVAATIQAGDPGLPELLGTGIGTDGSWRTFVGIRTHLSLNS